MNRIKNMCFWETIEDWVTVIEQKLVHVLVDSEIFSEAYKLDIMIDLAVENCLPLQIILVKDKKEKLMVIGEQTYQIFNFIAGRNTITYRGKKIYFSDFSDSKRRKILDAGIHSIWVYTEIDIYGKKFLDILKSDSKCII